MTKTPEERIEQALSVAEAYGQEDGEHHKAWVIDQMVRELTGRDYHLWRGEYSRRNSGDWDEGIAP